MTEEAATIPRRARNTDRAEEIGKSRRDRFEQTARDLQLRRFGVSDDILNLDRFAYRSAVDNTTGRLLQLTKNDDYDFVMANGKVTSDPSADGVLRYRSGTVDGGPQWSYLLAKPKKFADEHRAKALDKLKVEETARLTEIPPDAREQAYKPK